MVKRKEGTNEQESNDNRAGVLASGGLLGVAGQVCLRNEFLEHRLADREFLQPEEPYSAQHFPIPFLSLHPRLFLYSLYPRLCPLYYHCTYLAYARLASPLILFRHHILISPYGIAPSPRGCSHFFF